MTDISWCAVVGAASILLAVLAVCGLAWRAIEKKASVKLSLPNGITLETQWKNEQKPVRKKPTRKPKNGKAKRKPRKPKPPE
jgi:hypothetical protein